MALGNVPLTPGISKLTILLVEAWVTIRWRRYHRLLGHIALAGHNREALWDTSHPGMRQRRIVVVKVGMAWTRRVPQVVVLKGGRQS